MGREILFEGKRIDNGEWVYGSFIPDTLELLNGADCATGFIRLLGSSDIFEVYRETVGQYTGLTDKNDTQIFEHDIFKDSLGVLFVVSWDAENARYIGRAINNHSLLSYIGKEPNVEVIGNIHDNPELLKEQEE